MDTAELVGRLQAGDQHAVAELYSRYSKGVWAVAYRMLERRDLADDATQQTFVQAWQHAASLDPERDPGPWLRTVARRCAITALRREKPGSVVSLEDHGRTLESADGDRSDRAYEIWQVRRAVDALPPEERETLRLTHYGGLSHQEAAERLGVPVGTVKSRSGRAYKRLADRLGHLREEDVP